jgi:hypothetical protein
MTTTIDLAEATQALSKLFGPRYDASRASGRSTMVAVLSAQFSLAHREAAELLDALERACAIRWVPQPGAEWMNSRLGLAIELGSWKLERSVE